MGCHWRRRQWTILSYYSGICLNTPTPEEYEDIHYPSRVSNQTIQPVLCDVASKQIIMMMIAVCLLQMFNESCVNVHIHIVDCRFECMRKPYKTEHD
jgi:hypothetical protein